MAQFIPTSFRSIIWTTGLFGHMMTHLYLFWTIYTLDNIMDSAGHAVTLAKSTYLYILDIPTYYGWLTGSTYYMIFQRLELYWTRLSLVSTLFSRSSLLSCRHCITSPSSSVAVANITLSHRRWTNYDIYWGDIDIIYVISGFMGYLPTTISTNYHIY